MTAPEDPNFLDKRLVGASFDRAAARYNQAARLQGEVGGWLLERLDWLKLDPRVVLDVGCGTGRVTQALGRRYPKARVYAFDLAPNMLRIARRDAPRWFSRRHFACADAAALPVADACADLLVSNLMLQWCSDHAGVFREFARVLKPDGVLLFSTFGPDTLQELRASWAAVDARAHVNRFVDMHDLGDALLGSGFAHPVMDMDRLVRYYPDALGLMRELKTLGARNLNHGRARGLLGRAGLRAVVQAYETRRSEQGVPASFEVVYGYAQGPRPTPLAGRAGTTAVPLSALKRREG